MDLGQWFQGFLQDALDFVPHLIVAVMVFAVALLLSSPAERWIRHAAEDKIDDPSLVQLLARSVRWAVIVVGVIIALDQVNFDITGFVAGLGIAGLTIGFALQDIARNFIAGIILITRKPFKVGDSVEIAGYEGSVQNINTRDVVLKSWDGEKVIIPNINIFNAAITNITDSQYRRRTIRIGLGYGEDLARAANVFLGAIKGLQGVLEDPPVSILLEELGGSSISLVAYFWVDQKKANLFEVHSNAIRAIQEVAAKEGIEMPFPTQTVILEGGSTPNRASLQAAP